MRARIRAHTGLRGAIVLALALTIATGILTTGTSSGANSTVIVTANILSHTYISTNPSDPSPAGNCQTNVTNQTNLGTLLPGASVVSSVDCDVVFGSNNDDSMLKLYQADTTGKAMAMPSTGQLDAAFDGDGAMPGYPGNGKVTTVVGAATDRGNAVAQQADGKIVVVGNTNNGANDDFLVIRYNADGTLDTSFDGDAAMPGYPGNGKVATAIGAGSDNANAVAIQSDGKIVVMGKAANGANDDFAVVRYNTDGTLDTSFDGDVAMPGYPGNGKVTTDTGGAYNEHATAGLLQPDGKIVIGGHRCSAACGPMGMYAAVRYNTNGTLDTTFDTDGISAGSVAGNYNLMFAIGRLSTGDIILAGSNWSGAPFGNIVYLWKISPSGTMTSQTGFEWATGGTNDVAMGMAIQSDDKIVVVGTSAQASNDFGIARLTPAFALDTAFDGDSGTANGQFTVSFGGGTDVANGVLIQADGRIVVVGYATGANQDVAIARFLSDGRTDTSFGSGTGKLVTGLGTGNDQATGIALGTDQSWVISGFAGNATADAAVVRTGYTTFPDYDDPANDDWATAGSGLFGACLRTVSDGASTAGSTWAADSDTTGDEAAASADCADGDADPWNKIVTTSGTAGAKVAHATTVGDNDARAKVRFGVKASNSQQAGSYMATVVFEVIAPNVP